MAFEFMNKQTTNNNVTAQNEVKVQLRPQFINMVKKMSNEKSDLFYNGHHCIEMCILAKYKELYGDEKKNTIRPAVVDNSGFPSDDGGVDLMGNSYGGGRI